MSNMYKKLYSLFLITILISLSIFACRNASAENISSDEKSSFKVAVLLARKINADGWTRAGYEGLVLIEQELHAEIAYTESVAEADFERVFRQYARDGFDFIIGHGGQLVPAAEIVAEEFPRTKFAVVTKYGGNNKNLGTLSMRDSELAYLVGVVAALKTKTNKVGHVGGIPYAAGKEIATLFERGVKDINPGATVFIEWIGDFTDRDKAREIAQSQIENDADVLFTIAAGTSVVVHQLAEDAGVYTIGWVEDLHNLAPNTVVTSGIQDLPLLLLKGATLVRQGRWEGKQYKFGLREGVQRLAPFYGLLTPEEEAQVNAVKNDIISGKIDLTP